MVRVGNTIRRGNKRYKVTQIIGRRVQMKQLVKRRTATRRVKR